MEDHYSKFTRLVEDEKKKIVSETGNRSDAEMNLLHNKMIAERKQEELRALAIEIRSETLAVAQFAADALLRRGVSKKAWFTKEPEFEQKGFGLLRRDVFKQRITRYAFDGWNMGDLQFSTLGGFKELVLQEDGALSLVSSTSDRSAQAEEYIHRTPAAKRPATSELEHSGWAVEPIDTSIDDAFEMTLRRAFAQSDASVFHAQQFEAARAEVKARDPEGYDYYPEELSRTRQAERKDAYERFHETDVNSFREIDADARLQAALAGALARHTLVGLQDN